MSSGQSDTRDFKPSIFEEREERKGAEEEEEEEDENETSLSCSLSPLGSSPSDSPSLSSMMDERSRISLGEMDSSCEGARGRKTRGSSASTANTLWEDSDAHDSIRERELHTEEREGEEEEEGEGE
jgi:hypothetical protein